MNNNHPEILFKVTISEIEYSDFEACVPLYTQIVEQLDIKAVIDAVNNLASIPKKTRARSDRGKKHLEAETPAVA
jgi:hypothetical protein